MPISTKVLAGGLAGMALLLSAGAALAEPAQATGAVNVRSGPGVNYSIVDQLYPGETVDVGQCEGGWCHVDHSGPDGWVSANYLAGADEGYSQPPVYYDEEPEYVPGPIFVNPPGYYHRHHFIHHRRPPGGNFPPPPPGGNPPPHRHHRHFPPPVFPNNGQQTPHVQFHPNGVGQFHPNGAFPGGVKPQRAPHFNAGNSCTDPALCGGGKPNFHRQH
jgi:uncharacterized protein YraI